MDKIILINTLSHFYFVCKVKEEVNYDIKWYYLKLRTKSSLSRTFEDNKDSFYRDDNY